MLLGKITGTVVSSHKDEGINNLKLLLVQYINPETMKVMDQHVVAVDAVGAGIGEIVLLVAGSSARMTEATTGRPSDATIMAIIDLVAFSGDTVYDKSKSL